MSTTNDPVVLDLTQGFMLALRRGYTLMELLIVLTLTAVVTGLSLGRITSFIAHERVAKAAVGLATDIQAGFAIPGRIRRPVRIIVDTSAMQLVITDRSQTTTYRKTAFGSRYNLKSSNVALYPAAGTTFEIYPNGFASDSLVITLTSNGYSRSIKATKTGMVQVRPQ
jgi:prepilin-type N-terminal cleavage/methylation domain-containing protein